MFEFIIKRMVQASIVMFIIICFTFLLMHLIPGGPFLGEKPPTPQVLEMMEAKYGLDKPIPVQLKNYICNLIKGDLGISYSMQKNRPVIKIIAEMFPVSAKIGIIALAGSVLFGVPAGCIGALNRNRPIDNLLRMITTLGISIPNFVVAAVLLIVFGAKLKLLPTMELSGWQSYIMPCLTLALYPACYIGRLTRSGMLDVINQEYIRTARSKGLSSCSVIFKHALKNAFIPVLTYLGPLAAGILTGSFVVETVFNIPGLGRYFIQSIQSRDYPIIMGTTIFFAFLVVMMNLFVDILYKALDPRVDPAGRGR